MNNLLETQIESKVKEDTYPTYLNWKENPSVKKLLDVVVSILADEYIQIAKQNHEVFKDENSNIRKVFLGKSE